MTLRCDVLVAGGGPAGLAAAVAAGRAGARVVMLERRGALGGTATAGLLGTVCGLYPRGGAAPRLAAGGFAAEFAERLARASASSPLRLRGGLWALPYEPRAFERLADDLVDEVCAELALHATLAGVDVEGDRVCRVRALAWGDALAVEPACVVDATGEATVAALAGEPTDDGFAEQAAALVFRLEGADPGAEAPLPVLLALARGVEEGLLPAGCEAAAPVPGAAGGGLTLKLPLPPAPPGKAATPWRRVTAWEREGRARAAAIAGFLAGRVEGFGRARLGEVAAQVGVRSGRRLRGRATLTEAGVLAGARHPDGVARGAWPLERWGAGPRPELIPLPEGASYEIPLGCLRPRGIENLFAAGRCLAAEPGAAASARVIGTALGTGWAAGTLAAFAAAGRPLETAVEAIRREWGGRDEA